MWHRTADSAENVGGTSPDLELIGRLLRGEPVHWPSEPVHLERLEGLIVRHGVTGLVHARLRQGYDDAPHGLRAAIAARARSNGAVWMVLADSIREMLDALAAAGVTVLLLKGVPLALRVWPEPWMRERVDTDIAVADIDRQRAEEVLRSLGYEAVFRMPGETVNLQSNWSRALSFGIRDEVDLHWRLCNSHLLAGALNWAEAVAASEPLPVLGPAARTLCHRHALLLACLHRSLNLDWEVGSGGDRPVAANRLMWLADIHLLLAAMDDSEKQAFISHAHERRVVGLCHDALAATYRWLATDAAAPMLAALVPLTREPSAVLLRGSRLSIAAAELWAVPGAAARFRYLIENLLPPTSYIRDRYGSDRAWLVPFLYLHRIVRGARRRLGSE